MGLNTFVGSFAQRTSTGNQSVTGVGFTPKIVFFWASIQTADASGADTFFAFGAAVSSSDRRCMCWRGADAAGREANYSSDVNCIAIKNANIYFTTLAIADFVSQDADGFTLNWTTASAVARVINFMALAGTDLTNVKTGEEVAKTTNGTRVTTGLGFQPTALLLFFPINTNVANNDASGANQGFFGFTAGTTQCAVTTDYDAGTTPNAADRYQRTGSNACIAENSSSVTIEATLSSFDADGFTLNWTTTEGQARFFFYVALKGPQVKVGSFNQATATGNQATTGIGFQPSAIILQSFGNVSANTVQTNLRFAQGAGVSSTKRFCNWVGSSNNVTPELRNNNVSRTTIMNMMTEGGSGTPTTQASADLVSLDADGFTLNWGTADATAREIIYFAIGAAPAASGAPYPGKLPLLGVGP